MFSVFVRYKFTINENLNFAGYVSGIRLAICSKFPISQKNDYNTTIGQHDVIFNFWRCFVSFVNFSYCSKFYSNIITDSGVTVIFFYKGLTRDSEIGKNPSEFCSIYGDWGKLQIPSLVRISLIKCYWILQISRVIAFTVSEILRENQEWG